MGQLPRMGIAAGNRILMRAVVAFLVVSITASCTTQNRIEGEINDDFSVISVGDVIEVITKEPQRYKFRVTEITGGSIKGEETEILFEDIDIIYLVETSPGLTVAAIGSVAFVAYMALTTASLIALAVAF